MPERKQRQERLTYQDTIDRQSILSHLVSEKIKTNSPLNNTERLEFPKLIGDSFLSQGTQHNLYFNNHTQRLYLGTPHTLSLRLSDITTPNITLKNPSITITIPISELWAVLYDSFYYVFPLAIKEAIHISKEIPHRESTEGFVFSSTNEV